MKVAALVVCKGKKNFKLTSQRSDHIASGDKL